VTTRLKVEVLTAFLHIIGLPFAAIILVAGPALAADYSPSKSGKF